MDAVQTKKIGLKAFLTIAVKLAETLGQLHQKNIIHLDVKPHNILINAKSGIVKQKN